MAGGKRGILYVCATSIGNLKDITLRALETLRAVDFVVAEDTRVAKRLLSAYGIRKAVLSFHEHSPRSRLRHILKLLEYGHNIAIISDAGTPCVSDPGAELVGAALSLGIKVVPIPGPSALTAALSVAGMMAQRFIFLGFMPRDRKGRLKLLNCVKHWRHPLVIYEAPHRLAEALKDLLEVLGDRKLTIARELTKQFEEVFTTTLGEALRRYTKIEPVGEFTLVIEGSAKHASHEGEQSCEHDTEVDELIRSMLKYGSSAKDVTHAIMERFGLSHREAYRRVIKARKSVSGEQVANDATSQS